MTRCRYFTQIVKNEETVFRQYIKYSILAKRKTGCKDLCSFVAYNFQVAEGVSCLAGICSDVDCSILQVDKFELLCPLQSKKYPKLAKQPLSYSLDFSKSGLLRLSLNLTSA